MVHVDMRSLTPAAQEERRRQVIGLRESGLTYEAIARQVGLSAKRACKIVGGWSQSPRRAAAAPSPASPAAPPLARPRPVRGPATYPSEDQPPTILHALIITGAVAAGALVHTDEYNVYTRLPAWGYRHKTVCHARGEYARDEDDDGFCEVHVNTIEGFWSLLRSWLRPHCGTS